MNLTVKLAKQLRSALGLADAAIENPPAVSGGGEPFERHDQTMRVVKVDVDQRLVFGFFSIVEKGGVLEIDSHDEVIEPLELEHAVYDYVLTARVAGETHERIGVGDLVESVVFTAEKQKAIVDELQRQGVDATMDLKCVAWWGGFYITDDTVWAAVKAGDYPAFSIGGEATVEPI